MHRYQNLALGVCLFCVYCVWGQAKPLQPLACGDTIAVLSPSETLYQFYSKTRIKKILQTAQMLLEKRGFHIKHFDQLVKNPTYYGNGPAEHRAQALMAAFEDPDVNAIFTMIGGSTANQLIPLLDFDSIAAHPKIFIGKSDITALLLSLHQRAGMVTFHGPSISELALNHLNRKKGKSADLSATRVEESLWSTLQTPSALEYPRIIPTYRPFHVIQSGVSEGKLIGGNLTVIAMMMGLSHMFEPVFENGILFLEDVDNALDEFGRALEFLLYHGALKNIKGLVFSSVADIRNLRYHFSFGKRVDPAQAWFEAFVKNFRHHPLFPKDIPIVYGYSIGHIPDNMTVPIGIHARLDTKTNQLILLQSPFDNK